MPITGMVTIKEAAKLLELGYLQTRIYLGYPDDYCISKHGHKVFLYDYDKVVSVIEKRKATIEQRATNKGKHKCYHCGNRVPPTDLTSGVCSKCQAIKLVKNFACHGDYIHGRIDEQRLDRISDAVALMRTLV